jgi:photosystem II stability/assembly factor-like uncharacterized protein
MVNLYPFWPPNVKRRKSIKIQLNLKGRNSLIQFDPFLIDFTSYWLKISVMKNLLCCFILVLLFIVKSYSQFEWQHTDGPSGSYYGFIFSNENFAFVPQNDFLFRSPDGQHWEKIEHPVSDKMAVYHDTLGSLIWDNAAQKKYLHISLDNGLHWSIYNVPETINRNSSALSFSRNSINIVLLGKSWLFRSTDLGASWDSLSYPGQFTYESKSLNNRIYVFSPSLIKRSDTVAANWKNVTPPINESEVIRDIADYRDSVIVVATDDKIWYTHDAGATWSHQGLYPLNEYPMIGFVNKDLFVKSTGLLIRSKDFGLTWDTLQTSFDKDIVSVGGFKNSFLLSTLFSGIYRWDDVENQFVESNEGLSKGYIYNLSAGADKVWAYCANGLFAYTISSKTWSQKINLPISSSYGGFISANTNGGVLAYGNSNTIYFSENNGQSWDTIHTPFSCFYSDNVKLLNDNILAITWDGIRRSVDKGLTWNYLDIDFINTEMVYANHKYYMAYNDILYSTEDDGLSWIGLYLPFEVVELGSYKDQLYLVVDNNDNRELYLSDDGEHFAYSGKGYAETNTLLDNYYNNSYFRNADYYYSFTGYGEFFANAISDQSSGELYTSITGKDCIVVNDIIYLGGSGMYTAELENPFVTAVDQVENKTTLLFDISPNPVQNKTTLTFNPRIIPDGKLAIYSLDGRLEQVYEITGMDKINISTSDLAPGMYYVIYNGNNGVEAHAFIKL